MINREIKITIGVVAIVSLIFIAMSYAIFKVDITGNTDTIKFGDISLAFCKDSTCDSTISDIGNVIGTEKDANGNTVYSKIYPVSDPSTASDWNNLKPYIFTLTNDGDIPLYVSLYLEKDPTAGTIVSDGVEYSEFVSDDEVKIAIGEGTSTPTINLYSAKVDADGNHKIASNILINVGEKKTFKLYAWLKSDATNASQGKYFVTQISARGEYFPSGSSSDVDSNLKTIELDLKDATADKNVKQVLKGEDVEFIVTPTNTSKTLSDLTISCTNDVTPTVSGNTLKFSNVQKGTICSVYDASKGESLATLIQTNAVNENGYRYEGSDPNNYIQMEKTDGTKETWRIIGLFPDGENGENVIRVRKVGYESEAFDDGNHSTAYLYKNTTENKNNLLAYNDSVLNNIYLAIPDPGACSSCANHWPNTSLYITWKDTYSTANYKNTLNYKMYLGTSTSFSSYTTSDLYDMERMLNSKGKTGPSSNNVTTFIGSVGLMYPSDYGYGVLSSECVRTIAPYNYSKTSACYNNNWLYQYQGVDQGSNWQWLISPNASYSGVVGNVAYIGFFNLNVNVENTGLASPVMALKADVVVTGSGTNSDPYVMN